MASVTGLTAAKMLEIYNASIVDAEIDPDGNLILTTQGGTEYNVGDLHGPQGEVGPGGSVTTVNGKTGSAITLTAADVGAATAASVTAMVPAGTILLTGRSAAPTGYLLCQGQAISRTTYADLFAAIGTAYGTGNGSSTFNLPDLRTRTAVGRDTATSGFTTMGQKGGSATHSHGAGSLFSLISWGANGRILLKRISNAIKWTSNVANLSSSYIPVGTANEEVSGGIGIDGTTDTASSYSPYQVVNYMIKV